MFSNNNSNCSGYVFLTGVLSVAMTSVVVVALQEEGEALPSSPRGGWPNLLIGALGFSSLSSISKSSEFSSSAQSTCSSSFIIVILVAVATWLYWNQVASKLFRIMGAKQKKQNVHSDGQDDGDSSIRHMSLTLSDPFMPKEYTSQMTLRDVTDVFSYAFRVNQKGFTKDLFFAETNRRDVVTHAIHALDRATARSRGYAVLTDTEPNSSSDLMDALAFCGAVRIYSEWRHHRGIPQGYPKFFFGMAMAGRDLVKNLNKIEQAVHDMLNDLEAKQEQKLEHGTTSFSIKPRRLQSPTLRQLLEYELANKLHPKLPYLTEQSAANGMLWTTRQITYQSSTLDNNMRVPVDFPSPKAAFYAAYESVYSKYHTFFTAAFFKSTIDSAPPPDVVQRHMNAPYAQEEADTKTTSKGGQEDTTEDSSTDESSLETETTNGERTLVALQTPASTSTTMDPSRDIALREEVELAEKIAQVFTSFFAPCILAGCEGKESSLSSPHDPRNALETHHAVIIKGVSNVGSELLLLGHNDVPYYLSVLRPLEDGWRNLIDSLNMNDPIRA